METLATVKKEQNLSIVQQAFENFLKGNVQGIVDVCTDDIKWGAYYDPAVPFSKTYQGKNGVAEFFSALAGSVDYNKFELQEYYTDGDAVLVKGYQEAVVKTTGKTFGHDFLMQFKLRDGKVASFFSFINILDEVKAFTK